jgi:hypothetical protein
MDRRESSPVGRDRRISRLDPRVRAGKYHRLVAVGVTDQIWRGAVGPSTLEDDSGVFVHADRSALEVKAVTLRGSHGSSDW